MSCFVGRPVLGIEGGGASAFKAIRTTEIAKKWARICVEHGGASKAWVARVDENKNVAWISGWPEGSEQKMFWEEIQKNTIQSGQRTIFFDHQKLVSFGAFPILHKEQIIGLLALCGSGTDFFTPTAIGWIETLVISISHNFVQEKKTAKWKQVVNSINHILQFSLKLKDDLQLVLGILVDAINADAGLIFGRSLNQERYDLFAAHGLDASTLASFPLYISAGTVGREEYESIQFESLSEKDGNRRLATFHNKGYKIYVALPLIINWEVHGIIEIFWFSDQEDRDKLDMIRTVGGTISWAIEHVSMLNDLKRRNKELTSTYTSTIEGLSRALELRDLETQGHTRRVGELTLRLAKHMQIAEDQHTFLLQGALLHDIGKLGIPDAILLKPGSLTLQEWEVMKQHPQYAYDILAPIISLRGALDIPLYHHERWNGSGYPFGLIGEKIPVAARLFAIVDVFDALTSDRPYRSAWPYSEAVAYIREQAGELFDPEIVNKFLELIGR